MRVSTWLIGAIAMSVLLACGDTIKQTTIEGGTPCDATVIVACVCADQQIGQQHCEEGVLGACDCPEPIPPGQCRSDLDCSDGDFCNGVERCMRGDSAADDAGCMPSSTPPACDDGVACTTDRCSSVMNRCEHIAPDADQDGHADVTCLDANDEALGDDCDDADATRYPGNLEVCDLTMAGHDEDCDPTTYGTRDRDGDGSDDSRCCNGDVCGGDCDDTLIARHSGQPEFCDNRDNDCDGNTDEETGAVPWYVDIDGDGFGALSSGAATESCTSQPTRSLLNTDCDDADPSRHPAQLEVCDLRDQNCNLIADDYARCPYPAFPVDQLPDAGVDVPLPDGGVTCGMFAYPDVDGDGYGDTTAAVAINGEAPDCGVPVDHVAIGGDCNDNNAGQNPGVGRVDVCNLIDDDCDGVVDQALEADESCALPNTARTCVNGGCVIAGDNACPNIHYQDCDQNADNGCETDLRVSPNNCGACGMACDLGDGCGNSVCLDAPVVALAGGYYSTIALRAGNMVGWGNSPQHQLGAASNIVAPTAFSSLRQVTQVDLGYQHACARLGGAVHCWGNAPAGLGDGMSTTSGTPLRVVGIDDAIDLHVGFGNSCVIRSDRSVWCWGAGTAGELGNGAGVDSPIPVRVSGISDAIDISGGVAFNCALRASGNVSCWGAYENGRLGVADPSPNSDSALAPIAIPGLTDGIKLAASAHQNQHMCVVINDGSVRCWGFCGSGQLGTGSSVGNHCPSPVPMLDVTQVVDVAVGAAHTCVRTQAGAVHCTGSNSHGQISQYSGSTFFTPVPVPLPNGQPARQLTVGSVHACAVLGDASVACWGSNIYGELGSVGNNSATPITVVGFP